MPAARAGVHTLVDLLRHRAETTPDSIGYTWLRDSAEDTVDLTYAELDRRARAIASLLAGRCKPGDRVVVNHLPGLDYIASFFGCLYAGAIAVPVYPPRFGAKLDRLLSIVRDTRPAAALTSRSVLESLGPLAMKEPDLAAVAWLETDGAIASEGSPEWSEPAITGSDLAFLQYTSGSTSDPKGVMLSHSNLLANCEAISTLGNMDLSSKGLLWLPPYHDMGLIGGILTPIHVGFPVVLFSPYAFLQRPSRWLNAISRFKATMTAGPNFAFDLVTRKMTDEQIAALDLSNWKVAFCGAEPIRPETLDRFAARFAPAGFRESTLYPCYGLAEATLMVSGERAGVNPPRHESFDPAMLETGGRAVTATGPEARTLIGCGPSVPGHEVKIVDPETRRELTPGVVGEIWFTGPSVAQGYWGREQASEATFRARVEGDSRPYLRTGDLGFMSGGHLYVTGRIKDLVILRGRNIHPQDIEASLDGCHPALRAGSSAAFSIEDGGEEGLVVVQELDRKGAASADLADVARALQERIFEMHGLPPAMVSLARPHAIPLTSSGKVQRGLTRKLFMEGSLEELGRFRWSGLGQAPVPAAGGSA